MKNGKLVRQVKEATRAGFYAWPGGYPVYAICRDGGILCGRCVRKNFALVMRATRDGMPRDWSVMCLDVNWEDAAYCDNCSGMIQSAYGEEDADASA